MSRYLPVVPLGCMVLVLGACIQVYGPPDRPSPAPTQQETKGGKEDGDESKSLEPWEDVLKGARSIPGYFTFHLKPDNTLLLELAPERLGREFGLVMHYSRGLGDFNVIDGLSLGDTQLMRFERVGDRVYLVRVNPRFTADSGSPMRASLEENLGHSRVAAFEIKSVHEDSKHLALDMTEFFVSDYADVGRLIRLYYGNKPVSFEKARSHVGAVRGFPRNVELDAELTFLATDPPVFGGDAVSDYRSVPAGIRYSLFALPDEPMRPRLADDRLGHFLDAVRDFSRDREETTFRRYVNRWRLEKNDHTQAVSEPVEPIVYYVDRSVPIPYRRYVKEGIEAWNKAFAAAGFRNAIVARDAPDDTTWSAEDIRYSTVRWSAANSMGYAIGPSQTDPRTGEILNADVLISWSFVQGWLYEYQDLSGPDALVRRYLDAQRTLRMLPPGMAQRACLAAFGMQHQLGVQHALLVGLGVLDGGPAMPEEYLGDAIRDLVMHEVGHTLGLRHNFKGSSGIPHGRLQDTTFTRRHGVTLSVMDYGPVNVAPDPARQGHYWNKEIGTYDEWVIRYAYAPVYVRAATGGSMTTSGTPAATPEAELPGLRTIAAQAAEPLHAYGTDEDNWLGPWAVDPLTNAWDLGSDPVGYARDRVAVIGRVLPRLQDRLIEPGEGYQRLRGAFTGLIFERFLALLPVTKTVGGMYVARDHLGDPQGRPPFSPVPAAEQRRAVALLADALFAEDAFSIDPDFLNTLAPSRWAHWGVPFFTVPVDFPIHSYVALVQLALLNELLSPPRLTRLVDNEVRTPAGAAPYRLSELFDTLTDVIWSELGDDGVRARSITSFRRNLQRGHIDELIGLLHPRLLGVPQDAGALARYELTGLSQRIGAALAAGTAADTITRVHLSESKARIDRALEASVTVTPR